MTFYEIPQTRSGRLFIGPRPEAPNLQSWAQKAKQFGVDGVVCLMTLEEMQAKGISAEQDALAQHEIAFTHFPIADFGPPKVVEHFRTLITGLNDSLRSGQTVLVHCAGGIGRAGTTCSCVLVGQGETPDQAIEIVSQARGHPVPETQAQLAFVRDFVIGR
ncbi:MAG: dual specificity protein phosphatase family protein [Pseudomonadota bacterium]